MVLYQIFKEKNLSLFQPKKDQCDTCNAFKAGNVSEDLYRNHVIRKEAARDEKRTHDLQSVKLCPICRLVLYITKQSSVFTILQCII